MDLLKKYKIDLMKELLKIIGVTDIEKDIKDKTLFMHDSFESKESIEGFLEILPSARKLYSSDRLTALHNNAFQKQKNPGLNLMRQILKENGYDIKSKNVYKGIDNSQRKYERNYFFTHKQPKKSKIKLVLKIKH
jgi:hypothetical protein